MPNARKPKQPLHLRIFVSSPSDVAEERAAARKFIVELPYDPAFAGQITTEAVMYDDPYSPVPMNAGEPPQLTVNRYLGTPAECDLTIVILWSRLGMPVQWTRADGSQYQSGTLFELDSAGDSANIYRRTQPPDFAETEPEASQQKAKFKDVEDFFHRYVQPDGAPSGGINTYSNIEDFRDILKKHLNRFVGQRLATRSEFDAGLSDGPRVPLVRDLVGRHREFNQLHDLLARRENAVVVGPPGFGKTTLAAAVVKALQDEATSRATTPFPDGIVWLDLYRLRALAKNVFTTLADALKAPAGKDEFERARAACENQRILVIFEGAEEATGKDGRARLEDLLPVLATFNRRLVLTRNPDQFALPDVVRLDTALDPEDARALLAQLSKRYGRILDPAVEAKVIKLAQGHPLALTWASCQLLGHTERDPHELLKAWETDQMASLSDPDSTRRNASLRWLYLSSTGEFTPNGLTTLAAAGKLGNAPFPLSAITAALSHTTRHIDERRDQYSASNAVAELIRAGLLRRCSTNDHWEFTHVIPYRFARYTNPHDRVLLETLASWVHGHIRQCIEPATGLVPDIADLNRQRLYFDHLDAILRADEEQTLGQVLVADTLHVFHDRLLVIGRLELASEAIRVVDAWLSRALERDASQVQWLRERAVALQKLGRVQRAQGRLVDARQSLDASREIRAKLVAATPTSRQCLSEWASTLDDLGMVLRAQGEAIAALHCFEESRSVHAQLTVADPADALSQRALAVSYVNLGQLQRAQGDLTSAFQSFEQARGLRTKLADEDPANSDLQLDLSSSLDDLGHIEFAKGSRLRARENFDHSCRIRRKLSMDNPTHALYQRQLAVSLDNLGRLQRAQGDLAGALTLFEQAHAMRVRLADLEPTDARRRHELALSLDNVGSVLRALGQLDAALERFEASRAQRVRLIANDPTNLPWQHALAMTLDQLGDVQSAQDKRASARDSFEESRKLREHLVAAEADNKQWQRYLSASLNRLGNLQLEEGDLRSALASFEKSRSIRARLAALAPSHVHLQREHAVSLDCVGSVHLEMGKLLGAQSSFEQGRAIRETLLANDPDNPQWRRDLTVSLDYLGSTWLRKRDLSQARLHFEQSVSISGALVDREPTNSRWQHDLLIGLNKLGHVQREQGELSSAEACYERGRTIAVWLTEIDSTDQSSKLQLVEVYGRLGGVQLEQSKLLEAEQSYEHSRALGAALYPSDVPSRLYTRRLARVGRSHMQQQAPDRALEVFKKVLPIALALSAKSPDDPLLQCQLADIHEGIGCASLQLGQLDAAWECFELALPLRENLVKRNPFVGEWQRGLSTCHGFVGDLHVQRNELNAAEAAYRTEHDLRRQLARIRPEKLEWQLEWANNHARLGDIMVSIDRIASAITMYVDGVEALEQIVRRDGDRLDVRASIAALQGKLGEALCRLDRLEEAEAAYRQSFATWDMTMSLYLYHVTTENPTSVALARPLPPGEGLRELAKSLENLSAAYLVRSRKPIVFVGVRDERRAISLLQEALSIRSHHAMYNPDNPELQKEIGACEARIRGIRGGVARRESARDQTLAWNAIHPPRFRR